MTDEQAVLWWSSILDLFVRHNLDMTEVGKDFLTKASIRPGTQEIFDFCNQHSIPTVVLSAGISNVIDLWMEYYQINPSAVISTEFILDEHQCVTGWDNSTLVHALNKHEVKHPEINRIRTERTHAILVGDGLNDTTMATGDENVFRVFINDTGRDLPEIKDQVFDRYNFDCIISSGDLSYIATMLRRVAR